MLRPETDVPLPLSEFVVPEHEPDATIQERYEAFDAANPWVKASLIVLLEDAKEHGEPGLSIRGLFERLRWSHVATTDHPWKLNNNYTSRYARTILEERPDLAEMFRVRDLRAA